MSEMVVFSSQLELPFAAPPVDAAELSAATVLARYSRRTLESYRADLRGFFQWAGDVAARACVRSARTCLRRDIVASHRFLAVESSNDTWPDPATARQTNSPSTPVVHACGGFNSVSECAATQRPRHGRDPVAQPLAATPAT